MYIKRLASMRTGYCLTERRRCAFYKFKTFSWIFVLQSSGQKQAERYSEASVNPYQASRRHILEESKLLFIVITEGTQFSLCIHLALKNTQRNLDSLLGREIFGQQGPHIFIKKGRLIRIFCCLVSVWFIFYIQGRTSQKTQFASSELVKAAPLQSWSGPEDSRKLSFPDFMTTAQDDGKAPAPAAFTPRKYTWYSFLLEAESTPEPQ